MATIVLQTEGVNSRHRQQMETEPLIAACTSLLRSGRHASPLISRLQPPPLSVRPSHWEPVVPRARISRAMLRRPHPIATMSLPGMR